jgi:hypothetical protein
MDHLRLPEANSKVLLQSRPASVISAELIGSTECRCQTYGIRTSAYAPALAMCRELLSAGCSPDQAIEIYRAGVLVLRVRSIGAAADLVVEDSQHGRPRFRLARPGRRGAALPMRKSDGGGQARERLPNRRAFEGLHSSIRYGRPLDVLPGAAPLAMKPPSGGTGCTP